MHCCYGCLRYNINFQPNKTKKTQISSKPSFHSITFNGKSSLFSNSNDIVGLNKSTSQQQCMKPSRPARCAKACISSKCTMYGLLLSRHKSHMVTFKKRLVRFFEVWFHRGHEPWFPGFKSCVCVTHRSTPISIPLETLLLCIVALCSCFDILILTLMCLHWKCIKV